MRAPIRMLAIIASALSPPVLAQAADVAAAQRAVRAKLREPASARFLDVTARNTKNVRGEPTRVVCGRVSARGGAGGMSAAVPFVYNVATGSAYVTAPSIVLDPEAAGVGQLVHANLCGR